MTRFVYVLVLCACAAAARGAATPRTIEIQIRQFAFVAPDTAVRLGDTVAWTNADAFPHTATADSGAWSSPELATRSRFVFVPKRTGRYGYHCAAHPVMRGMLVVRD